MDPSFPICRACQGALGSSWNKTWDGMTNTAHSCKLVYASFGDVDQFGVNSVECYERTLLQAEQSGIKVRALVLANPHNPLGVCAVVLS